MISGRFGGSGLKGSRNGGLAVRRVGTTAGD